MYEARWLMGAAQPIVDFQILTDLQTLSIFKHVAMIVL